LDRPSNRAAVALIVKISIRRAIAAGIDPTLHLREFTQGANSCPIRFKFVKVLIGLVALEEKAIEAAKVTLKAGEPG
jgi:hypothetical protein